MKTTVRTVRTVRTGTLSVEKKRGQITGQSKKKPVRTVRSGQVRTASGQVNPRHLSAPFTVEKNKLRTVRTVKMQIFGKTGFLGMIS